jgi:hypothetical protein
MSVQIDLWIRGNEVATTAALDAVTRSPEMWDDDDVRLVLEEMLRAMHRLKHPTASQTQPITLRGLSWIVNPFEGGGVVIAIEITLGAAIAGPLNIDKTALETMIARVLARPAASMPTIH